MIKPVLATFAAVLIALLGAWLWGASGHSDPDRALQASGLQRDLLEAQGSLVGARVDLSERKLQSARRRLEDARVLLRRADARGKRLGWRDQVQHLDLAAFEADIDEAQRLLDQLLEHGAAALGSQPQGAALVEGVPTDSMFRGR